MKMRRGRKRREKWEKGRKRINKGGAFGFDPPPKKRYLKPPRSESFLNKKKWHLES